MPNAGLTGFADLVAPGGVCLDLVAADKPALLLALAEHAAGTTGVSALLIAERLQLREALGSTGFGGGAAIPHARLLDAPAIVVVVARLTQAIDYAAIDAQPVDIAVLMLTSETAGADHLKALARISRTLRDPVCLAAMRAAATTDEMWAAIGAVHEAPRRAA